MNKLKLFVLVSIFCLAMVMPLSYAGNNESLIAADSAIHNSTQSGSNVDDVVSDSYYFDSNVENDTGNGSVDNPFRDLKNVRMMEGSTLYLAEGEYRLDKFCSLDDLTIIGSDPLKTIVKYDPYSLALESFGTVVFKNVTFISFRFQTYGSFFAENVIFQDTCNYDNRQGGAITSNTKTSSVILENCTFSDNYSPVGGAISINGGKLSINNSRFITNHASKGGAIYVNGAQLTVNNCSFIYNYAGACAGSIFCENDARCRITKSEFLNGYAEGDVAGAIYLINSNMEADQLEISNCSSNFGGAIVSLKSTLKLNNFLALNNKANYGGGAVFVMYREFSIFNSKLINNSASEGGALYVSDVDTFLIRSNSFINNTALKNSSAICAIGSDTYYDSILDDGLNNTFINNDVSESVIPSLFIGNGTYLLINYDYSYDGSLPTSYNLRDYGYVTPVKNQVGGGNCWAFAVLGALESCLLKATGTSYDLSEENMKNLMSLYSDYGWAMQPNEGGYDDMAIGYLTSWLGPINESDDIYSDYSVLSPVLNSILHIQNILFLTRTSYTDNDEVKRAIMNYGGVSTSIYWISAYLKDKNYYYNGNSAANHAIVIVGWDDTYSRENFKNKPEGDGAWIIKNSWGTDNSGDNGFYYVSYYDRGCVRLNNPTSTFTFVFNDTMRYDRNYQYDVPGLTDFFLNTSSTVWYKNRFISLGEEYLAAVSTYFEKDTNWQLSIYVNNQLKLTKTGFSTSSYRTIDLGQLIHLNEGDVFEVVFRISVDGRAGVPISERVTLNYGLYSQGISYISYNGRNWVDFYELEWSYPDHVYDSQVACIKAFTIFDKLDTQLNLTVVNDYNPVTVEARVHDQYGNLVTSGSVTFTVENQRIRVGIENGVAKLNYMFKNPNDNLITAVFAAEGYNGNSSMISTNANEVVLIANDLTDHARYVTYSATLMDNQNRPVSDKEIKFTINNNVYTAFTNRNGVASVNLILDVGIHEIEIGFVDESKSKDMNLIRKITALSTVTLPASTRYTYNSNYIANLVDGNGNALANTRVNVVIGSGVHAASTDSKGILKYNLKLAAGSYKVSIVNLQTGETKSHTINVVARLSGNYPVTMYYGAVKYYKVRAFDDYGNVAKGAKVVFYFNGKYFTRYTDNNGWASLKLAGIPKVYTITATYNGYKVSNRITIKPTLIMNNKVVKRNKVFNYCAKLLGTQGNILKYKAVTVKFAGKTYFAKTNYMGIATFKLRTYSLTGKFNICAIYGNAKITKIISIIR